MANVFREQSKATNDAKRSHSTAKAKQVLMSNGLLSLLLWQQMVQYTVQHTQHMDRYGALWYQVSHEAWELFGSEQALAARGMY